MVLMLIPSTSPLPTPSQGRRGVIRLNGSIDFHINGPLGPQTVLYSLDPVNESIAYVAPSESESGTVSNTCSTWGISFAMLGVCKAGGQFGGQCLGRGESWVGPDL